MIVRALFAASAFSLALAGSAAGQVAPGQPPLPATAPPPVLPNANQTAMPSPTGTMPNANQTPEGSAATTLPRADGTIAPDAVTAPVSPACRSTSMTTNCNPAPIPACVSGQTVPVGSTCPSPTVP